MKSISTAQHLSIISLLNEGYSHHQIQARTGLRKGIVGRIGKKWNGNKENNSGRLDNAVQATQFINSVIPNSIHSQIVGNVLNESGFYSSTKKKAPMLKQTHHQRQLKSTQYHENWIVEDWKRV